MTLGEALILGVILAPTDAALGQALEQAELARTFDGGVSGGDVELAVDGHGV